MSSELELNRPLSLKITLKKNHSNQAKCNYLNKTTSNKNSSMTFAPCAKQILTFFEALQTQELVGLRGARIAQWIAFSLCT